MSGKKIVLKLDINDDEAKKKALKAVSGVQGIDSVSMDMKEKKMTVIGEVDPVEVVTKLKGKKKKKKNKWYIEIVTVGPAKEPEKKKEEPKKDETAKKEEPKKDDNKKKDIDNERIAEMVKANYNPWLNYYYHVHSVEENPNACVIV